MISVLVFSLCWCSVLADIDVKGLYAHEYKHRAYLFDDLLPVNLSASISLDIDKYRSTLHQSFISIVNYVDIFPCLSGLADVVLKDLSALGSIVPVVSNREWTHADGCNIYTLIPGRYFFCETLPLSKECKQVLRKYDLVGSTDIFNDFCHACHDNQKLPNNLTAAVLDRWASDAAKFRSEFYANTSYTAFQAVNRACAGINKISEQHLKPYVSDYRGGPACYENAFRREFARLEDPKSCMVLNSPRERRTAKYDCTDYYYKNKIELTFDFFLLMPSLGYTTEYTLGVAYCYYSGYWSMSRYNATGFEDLSARIAKSRKARWGASAVCGWPLVSSLAKLVGGECYATPDVDAIKVSLRNTVKLVVNSSDLVREVQHGVFLVNDKLKAQSRVFEKIAESLALRLDVMRNTTDALLEYSRVATAHFEYLDSYIKALASSTEDLRLKLVETQTSVYCLDLLSRLNGDYLSVSSVFRGLVTSHNAMVTLLMSVVSDDVETSPLTVEFSSMLLKYNLYPIDTAKTHLVLSEVKFVKAGPYVDLFISSFMPVVTRASPKAYLSDTHPLTLGVDGRCVRNTYSGRLICVEGMGCRRFRSELCFMHNDEYFCPRDSLSSHPPMAVSVEVVDCSLATNYFMRPNFYYVAQASVLSCSGAEYTLAPGSLVRLPCGVECVVSPRAKDGHGSTILPIPDAHVCDDPLSFHYISDPVFDEIMSRNPDDVTGRFKSFADYASSYDRIEEFSRARLVLPDFVAPPLSDIRSNVTTALAEISDLFANGSSVIEGIDRKLDIQAQSFNASYDAILQRARLLEHQVDQIESAPMSSLPYWIQLVVLLLVVLIIAYLIFYNNGNKIKLY